MKLINLLIVTLLTNLLALFIPWYWNSWMGYLILLLVHLLVVMQVSNKFPTPRSPALEILADSWPVGSTLGVVGVCVLSGMGYHLHTCAAVSALCIIIPWLLTYAAYRVIYHYTSRIRPW